MITAVLQSALIFGGTWIAWSVLKHWIIKSPLSIIPGPPSESWVTGSFFHLLGNNDAWAYLKKTTDEYGGVFRFTGLFNESALHVYDAKALHHVVVKDQYIYEEPEEFISINLKVFGQGLLSTLGDHHRKQRKLLNPVFSIAHMREMTPTFYNVVDRLRDTFARQVAQGEKELDILSWMTRIALELIGQSGFGYSFDDLTENNIEHPFATSIKDYVRTVTSAEIMFSGIFILPYVQHIGSPAFQRAVVNFLPWKRLHELRDQVDMMHNTSVEILEATKQSLKDDPETLSKRIGGGKDIMSIMVKANMAASEEDKLPEAELLAQISTLTFAAMDTTSNSLARILHLLSEHPEVQEKLRQEVTDAYKEHGGQLDYDELTALPYLDAICRETLRLHATIPQLSRRARKDMILPLGKPITSTEGKVLDEIFVPKGTRILMGLMYCNRDPDIWGPDALEWKPERWLAPLPDSVSQARVPGVYSNLMTFLGGGRACIGFKFSQLEMKVVLAVLVQSFRFTTTEKKIEWQLNGIVQPTVEDAEAGYTGNKKLQLPLKVSLV